MPSAYNLGKPALTRGKWTTRWYTVAASETFVKGDHVMLNSSGQIVIAAAVDNNVGAVKLLGIAEGNAVDILALEAGRRECPVAVPAGVESAEFLVQIYHGTFASATIAETDMDAPPTYEMRNTSTGWSADKSATTNAVITLTERHQRYPFGETGGWFWAKYNQADGLYAAS